MQIEFFGATREVTGSCYQITVGDYRLLVECGIIQGSHEHERHNEDPFPFDIQQIDAVILTHAHLDHSGRLPLLVKRGYRGPIYTHHATVDLCNILLQDAGYLNEKEAQWQNKKRERKGLELVEALYTRIEAGETQQYFHGLAYEEEKEILPGVHLTLHDAGHILGSAIVDLVLNDGRDKRKVVFSGDLGHVGAPILRDPQKVDSADLLIMESTYGDRLHRQWDSTWQEIGDIIANAKGAKGNIIIPAFAVGRMQELIYTFKSHFDEWNLADWDIFLDSPMGISATEVYARHLKVYDAEARAMFSQNGPLFDLPNLHYSERTDYSMKINQIKSGAIIIAGSGMCTGGRIKHHLKHNIWRQHAHILIVGFQARGTLGRALVDGTKTIHLWGEEIRVKAQIHTVGGLSAHADQAGLLNWSRHFSPKTKIALVHGEADAMDTLSERLKTDQDRQVIRAEYRQKLTI
jgi:metallo-beta-lactamase family protein